MSIVCQSPPISLPTPASAARAGRSLRIGIYTPSYPGVTGEGGIGTYTRNLAHGLIGLGHEVHVLTPGEGPAATDGRITIHFTSTRYVRGLDRLLPGVGACWRVARAMRTIVHEQRLDVVEFPNWQGYGALLRPLMAIPIVVRLHTSALETQKIDGLSPTRELKWDARREHWQVRRATALVTHSDAHRRMMAEELGIPAERMSLVPHGVETFPDFVRPARGHGPHRVVFLGRLEKRKGSLDLLHAARQVLKELPDTEFLLIGSDRAHCPGGRTHAEYLRDEFTPREQAQIRLAGRLPDDAVDHHLQTCDVFVAPSLYESFGLILPEAMRWGAPVISTRAGGIPEIIRDGETGVLVPPSAPDALSAAIIRLLQDESERARLGAAGRQFVEERLCVEVMARQMSDFYQRVVKERQPS
jgi:glycogen(starch) synthase